MKCFFFFFFFVLHLPLSKQLNWICCQWQFVLDTAKRLYNKQEMKVIHQKKKEKVGDNLVETQFEALQVIFVMFILSRQSYYLLGAITQKSQIWLVNHIHYELIDTFKNCYSLTIYRYEKIRKKLKKDYINFNLLSPHPE